MCFHCFTPVWGEGGGVGEREKERERERERRRDREGGRERGKRYFIEASTYMGNGRCGTGGGRLGVREMRKGEGDAERRDRRGP